MPDDIKIFDTTLRDGEQSPGCSMNHAEKLEVARQLERLKVDVIEAGFAIASPGDFEAVRAVAAEMKETGVAALARTKTEDIDAAAGRREGRRPPAHPYLHRHLAHPHALQAEDVARTRSWPRPRKRSAYARNLCPEVEFSAEDATRSDPEFLCRVFEAAIGAGATRHQRPGHGRLHDARGVREPDRLPPEARPEHRQGRDLRPLPQRPGHGRGQHPGRRPGRRHPARMHDQRHRRAGRERRPGGGRDGPAHPPRPVRLRPAGWTRNRSPGPRKLVSSLIGVPVPPNKAVVGGNAFAHESGHPPARRAVQARSPTRS